ncbi:MAG: nucleoside deaminase [Candidatus Omnitrophica bacterium]|nr:nucleoside deaminase [Candidatus Omnitrophota bacterium]
MGLAIAKAREGIGLGQTPFGACIVKNGKMVSCEHNAVWKKNDITAHAEIQAIRKACQKLKSVDLFGCIIYSTCEPCPMCFAACHWARIDKIVYGSSIKDAQSAGFNELKLSSRSMKFLGRSKVKIQAKFMPSENAELFVLWGKNKKRKKY